MRTIIKTARGTDGQISLLEDKIIIRKGIISLGPELEIPINQISQINYKKASNWTNGYIHLIRTFEENKKLNVFTIGSKETAIIFRKKKQKEFDALKSLLEIKLSEVELIKEPMTKETSNDEIDSNDEGSPENEVDAEEEEIPSFVINEISGKIKYLGGHSQVPNADKCSLMVVGEGLLFQKTKFGNVSWSFLIPYDRIYPLLFDFNTMEDLAYNQKMTACSFLAGYGPMTSFKREILVGTIAYEDDKSKKCVVSFIIEDVDLLRELLSIKNQLTDLVIGQTENNSPIVDDAADSFCGKCGNPRKEGNLFCTKCRYKFE
jgi:hypothetical protein